MTETKTINYYCEAGKCGFITNNKELYKTHKQECDELKQMELWDITITRRITETETYRSEAIAENRRQTLEGRMDIEKITIKKRTPKK